MCVIVSVCLSVCVTLSLYVCLCVCVLSADTCSVVGKGKSARMSSKGKHPAKRVKLSPTNELVTSAKLSKVSN